MSEPAAAREAALSRASAMLPLTSLREHPKNPRKDFSGVDTLAQDMRRRGVLTPLIVKPYSGQFYILAGHRRARAAALAGLTHVPCDIRPDIATDKEWEVLLAENVHRQNLNPIEEAKAFDELRESGLTQLDIASRLNVSEQRVSRRLGLLLLDEETQQLIIERAMTMEEAWEVVRDLKPRKGPKPGSGYAGRTTKYDRYFNWDHPLHGKAFLMCQRNKHPDVMHHLGPACGACWEAIIRLDEAVKLGVLSEVPESVGLTALARGRGDIE